MDIFLNYLVKLYLNNMVNLYAKLYPQNGERIVTLDSATSIHPMYKIPVGSHESAPNGILILSAVGVNSSVPQGKARCIGG